jgi:cytochrome c-type biogenesis protein CcmH
MNFKKNSLRNLFLVLFLIGLIFTILPIGAVSAQEISPPGPTDDQINAIAKQLYCPVCENIPLDVCPTQACAQWRALIGEKLALGWTEDEIKTYFAAQYGDRVLAAPPPRGLNWLAYVIPPLAIILGGFILYRALRAWRQPPSPVVSQSPPEEGLDDDYLAKVEEELRRR